MLYRPKNILFISYALVCVLDFAPSYARPSIRSRIAYLTNKLTNKSPYDPQATPYYASTSGSSGIYPRKKSDLPSEKKLRKLSKQLAKLQNRELQIQSDLKNINEKFKDSLEIEKNGVDTSGKQKEDLKEAWVVKKPFSLPRNFKNIFKKNGVDTRGKQKEDFTDAWKDSFARARKLEEKLMDVRFKIDNIISRMHGEKPIRRYQVKGVESFLSNRNGNGHRFE